VRLLAQRTAELKVGDGSQPGVQIGPLVDEAQFNTVMSYLEIGKQEGAQVLRGGGRSSGGSYDRGWFVAPTIFDHVNPNIRIARQGIFGRMLSVNGEKNEENNV